MTKSEWKCKRCKYCCRNFTIDAQNTDEILKAFYKETGIEIKKAEKIQIHIRGKCTNLVGRDCMAYDKRPELCKTHFCKRYSTQHVGLYQKLCKVCWNVQTFQSGTDRDKQSVCGNCWVW